MQTLDPPELTYDLSLLDESRTKWDSSPSLREYYRSLYEDILTFCPPRGERLEIGSGIGVSKSFIPNLTTSDLVKTPFVDRALDCYQLNEDEKDRWGAIIGLDVFHHLRYPIRFLERASQSLQAGGRVILMEPAATVVGRAAYGLCHHEPMILDEVKPPFEFDSIDDGEFSNMAMAQGIFRSHENSTGDQLSEMGLAVVHLSYRDVAAYFLTGGFSRPSFLPKVVIKEMLKVEKRVPQTVLRLVGLRVLVVLEKVS